MGVLDLFRRAERRDLNFGDAVAEAVATRAAGDASLPTGVTGAMEIAAGWWSRGFASATVTSTPALARALNADVLADIGRALCLLGESVWLMDAAGGLRFRRASVWTIKGGPERADWEYSLTIQGPTALETVRAPSSRVFHPMYAHDPFQPWKGKGPLSTLSRQLAINIEARLSEETGGNVGNVIPVPTSSNKGELQTDIRGLKGKTGLVDSTAGGWDQGQAPSGEWTPRRLGANPPPTLPTLRGDVEKTILAACGIPPEAVMGGQGTASREAFRRFLHLAISPSADILGAQLEDLTDDPVKFNFDRLMASDIQGRARAFQSMVGGGMDIGRAAALSGLLAVDDEE